MNGFYRFYLWIEQKCFLICIFFCWSCSSTCTITYQIDLYSRFLFIYQDCISYAYLSLDSAGCKGISFTLAAITKSNYSRTSKRVWGDEEGVIWLCVLRRSKSSDIWRLCRVSVGLSLDYG